MQRKLAFCVGQWSADSTLFSWTYAKQYFLRKVRDENGNETLSDLDRLYIVHVNTGKVRERWDAGGPLLPRLSTALENYPYTMIELEGRDTAAAILEFAAREDIDVLILGSREHKGAMTKMVPGVSTLGSTSDMVKARSRCPCLIIRPSSARNEKMRIKSMVNLGQLMDGQNLQPGSSLPQPMKVKVLAASAGPEPRKVCIAFEHAESGNNMCAWAAKHCLYPDDDVHLVHMTNRSPLEKMQKSASFQKAMLKPKVAELHVTEENVDGVGQEELHEYEEPRRARLKGDAKAELCEYLDEKHIDLLIVGFSATNRFRKALTGGSLSSHMLHHAPCPILVLPLKSMTREEHDTLSNLPELRPSISGGFDTQLSPNNADGGSPPGTTSLGPRVSMSRSLSHQLSQSKEQFRQHHDGAATSPSSKSLAGAFSHPKSEAARLSREASGDGSGAQHQARHSPRGSRERLPTQLQIDTDLPAPVSPFEVSASAPQRTSESAPEMSKSFASPPAHGKEVTVLQQQLAERDSEIAALRDELRQLKFQVAALKGSSSPGGRVMLPAS